MDLFAGLFDFMPKLDVCRKECAFGMRSVSQLVTQSVSQSVSQSVP